MPFFKVQSGCDPQELDPTQEIAEFLIFSRAMGAIAEPLS
jgi:hypothetical protein